MLTTIPYATYILRQYEWYLLQPNFIPRKEIVIHEVVHALYFDSHVTDVPFHVDLEHQAWDQCADMYDKLQLFSLAKKYEAIPVVMIW